jgi:hypothetical protein
MTDASGDPSADPEQATDGDDLPIGIYRQCVEWCEAEGVTEAGDLAGRVLNADEFETQWVERCQAVADSDE